MLYEVITGVVHRTLGGVGREAEHGGHLRRKVLPDKVVPDYYQGYPRRSEVFLGSRVDDAEFRHVQGPAEDVRGGVRHEGDVSGVGEGLPGGTHDGA